MPKQQNPKGTHIYQFLVTFSFPFYWIAIYYMLYSALDFVTMCLVYYVYKEILVCNLGVK